MNFRLFVGLEGSYNIRWGYKPTLCTINDSLNWNLRLEVESSVIVAMYAKEILAVKYLWKRQSSFYNPPKIMPDIKKSYTFFRILGLVIVLYRESYNYFLEVGN